VTKVSRIYFEKPVSAEVAGALDALGAQVVAALDQAREAGAPQGLIVAIMAGHFQEETARMLAIRDNNTGA
jgi:hypothetical protein